MRPPVGSAGPGAGDRARLDRFRLRRGLEPEHLPAYAAARLAALGQPSDGPRWRPLGPFAIPRGRTAGSGPSSRSRVGGRVTAVAVDPGDPGHLLAGGGGLWERRDGGRGWRPTADDQPSPAIGAIAFAPGAPAVAYAGTGRGEPLAALGVGLLRSEDGGSSWRLLVARELLGVGFHDLLVDREDAGRLLAATTGGLWASPDGGAGWERRLAGRCWAVSAGPDGELLAGGQHGLHRSTDGGATWRPVELAARPGAFDRVAVAHAAGGQVAYVFAAGDGVGHLWRRDRAGGPFAPLRPPADLQTRQAWHCWACAVDPADPDVLWLGAHGLHRGTRGPDGRWSWTDLTARPSGDSLPPGQHAVVFDPTDPRVLYVAGDGGLFRSPDAGRTWRSLNPGLAVAEVDHLAAHPGDGWLLAAADTLGTLRYEGGEVWFQVAPGEQGPTSPEAGPPPAAADETVTALVVDPARPGTVWSASAGPRGGRVWRSGDGGSSWAERGQGLPGVPVSALALDPDRPGTVFAATDAGVWRSQDDGSGWHRFGRGLPNAPALALTLDLATRRLRVGLLGRAVWEAAADPGPAPTAPVLRPGRFDPDRARPGGWWWECPDIKVEVPPAPRDAPVEPVLFEDDRGPDAAGLPDPGGLVHPGRPARVHVQVHHRGDAPLADVRVRVLAAPAGLNPPDLPDHARPAGDPPAGSPWRVVGPPGRVEALEPGRSAVVSLDWDVPADLPGRVCLLAVASAGGDDPATTGSWGLKSVTVLGPGWPGPPGRGAAPARTPAHPGRVVRLDLWGGAGGPFALAAEGWVHELTAGLLLGRRLADPARRAGLVPARVAEAWRPELVTLVQEDPTLAQRLDLAAAFPPPATRPAADPVRWLEGIDLPPDEAEPLVLLLGDPPSGGAGSLLLLDAEGRVAGGHTLRAAG